jgi:hypothetical protein
MRFWLHQNNSAPIGQRKHDLYTWARMTRHATNRIGSRVENVSCCTQLAHPCCLHQLACTPIPHLEHLTAHALAAVQRRQRDVQLLQSPAEKHCESRSKWLVQAMPFRPSVEFIFRCPLVEIPNSRRNCLRIDPVASKPAEVLHQSAGPSFHHLKTTPPCVLCKEALADDARISYRSIQPAIVRKSNPPACRANPLLGDPVAKVTRSISKPNHLSIIPRVLRLQSCEASPIPLLPMTRLAWGRVGAESSGNHPGRR